MGRTVKVGGISRVTKTPAGGSPRKEYPGVAAPVPAGPGPTPGSGGKPYNQLASRGGIGRMYDGSGNGGTGS